MTNQSTGLIPSLTEVLEKVDVNTFYNISFELLRLRTNDNFILEIEPTASRLGYSVEKTKDLQKLYNIQEEVLQSVTNALSYLLRTAMTSSKENLLEKLKSSDKLINQAEKLAEVASKILEEFPDIQERYYLKVFCKTLYLEDIDWEIVIKAVEPEVFGFEKSDRFSVSTVRLFLSNQPAHSIRVAERKRKSEEITFEITKADVDRIIQVFSTIKEKITALESEKLKEMKE